MTKSLKEIFGLREMSVNVPDKDAPALQKIIDIAVQHGQLPPDAAHWIVDPKASKAKGSKVKTPVTDPLDPQSAWDALAGSKAAPAAKPAAAKSKAPAAPADPTASWGAPKSANVRLGPEPEADDAPYKSPFAWDKIDPQGTRGTDMDVPDLEPGTVKTLRTPQPKGPGLASRVAGGIKNAFKGKPDGQKELDKFFTASDKQAAKANTKQGALSKIFKGRDVTRGQ